MKVNQGVVKPVQNEVMCVCVCKPANKYIGIQKLTFT